jgi:hypothetical protein
MYLGVEDVRRAFSATWRFFFPPRAPIPPQPEDASQSAK